MVVHSMSETPSPKDSKEEQVPVPTIGETESLKKALKEEQEKANNYLNRLKYLQADFENFQKRTQKEMDNLRKYGNQCLILELLTIRDELEYAIEAEKCSDDKKAITKGVEMTLKKVYETLEREGVSRIDAIGKPFDPTRHEAVENVPTKDYKEGIVIEEIRKGFMLNGQVIRPSLVKVAVKLTDNNFDKKVEKESK